MNDSPKPAFAGAAGGTARPVIESIPAQKAQRENLRAAVERYVADQRPVPPLSMDELGRHVEGILAAGAERKHESYVTVLLNNAAWKESLSAVPFDRRLLLLPQCLKDASRCRGRMDAFGLVCGGCGSCPIGKLKQEAERLGYAVLVAEGVPVVMSLIQNEKIRGIVGVSCLASLQRVYPYMDAAAVPAVAVPLLQDGCADTTFDFDWAWEALHWRRDGKEETCADDLYREVELWFERPRLAEMLGQPGTTTGRLAMDWLLRAGKRWRPFLAACAFEALADGPATHTDDLRRAAVAVECFHKASLIHDDIEDADESRYGQETLHRSYGIPVALNVGDLLLGEGYRLIGQCNGAAGGGGGLLAVAADGHRELCLGQGEELWWLRARRALGVEEVLDIFRRKTAPAFEVALRFGAICAGAGGQVDKVLGGYSEHLGIAYQIHDDLADEPSPEGRARLAGGRPSILLALAHQAARGADRDCLEGLYLRPGAGDNDAGELHRLVAGLGVRVQAMELLRHHLDAAVQSLQPLRNVRLKRMLRQVLWKVFQDVILPGGE